MADRVGGGSPHVSREQEVDPLNPAKDVCRNCGRPRDEHKQTRGGPRCLNGRQFKPDTAALQGPEEVEVGWRDQHGDKCHVLLGGWEAINRYACPEPIEAPLADDVVGIVEVTPAEPPDPYTLAAYLPRAQAEALYSALGTVLSAAATARPDPDWEKVARGLVGKCAVPLEALEAAEHNRPWLSPEMQEAIRDACDELREAARLFVASGETESQ